MSFLVETQGEGAAQSIVLRDSSTGCSATIFRFGALLNAFSLPTVNGRINIVDGFADAAAAIANITKGFNGAKINPYVCRLQHGQYQLDQDIYQVSKFFLPPHAIHGLVYDAVYDVLELHADTHHSVVRLQYIYKQEDAGYPFEYSIEVRWQLSAHAQLSVTTTVQNLSDRAIPMTDGWHPYFTLGGSIDDCTLRFESHTQVVFDETLIPTGKLKADHRFTEGALLKDIFLDNCFLLNNPGHSACTLENQHYRLTVQPGAHYPYLQLYTPDHRKSIAIENLSAAPDAFNNGMGLVLVAPKEHRSFTTGYHLQIL